MSSIIVEKSQEKGESDSMYSLGICYYDENLRKEADSMLLNDSFNGNQKPKHYRKGKIAMKGILRIFLLFVFGCAMLVASAVPISAVSLYTSDYSGNLYLVETDPWQVSSVGLIQSSPSATLVREMAMDYDPDGELYTYTTRSQTGQLGRRYHYGEVYLVDVSTVGDNTVGDATEPSNENFGTFGFLAGSAQPNYDAGLAFRNDGKFFTSGYRGSPDSGNKIHLNDFDSTTPREEFTTSSYDTRRGLEWYDDGSVNGQLFALSGGLQLQLVNLNYVTHGFSVSSYATVPNTTGMTFGDLSLYEDILYVLLSGTGSSRLYSYDLTQGAFGSFDLVGNLSQTNLKSLAAMPAAVVPEPASIGLFSMGLIFLGNILRRKV